MSRERSGTRTSTGRCIAISSRTTCCFRAARPRSPTSGSQRRSPIHARRHGAPTRSRNSAHRLARRVAMWMASAAAAAVLWFGSGGYRRERWVRAEAIPRIKDYVERGQADSAWLLAREVSEAAPNDTALANLWPRFAWKLVFHSKPEGAKIYRASYEDTTHWV